HADVPARPAPSTSVDRGFGMCGANFFDDALQLAADARGVGREAVVRVADGERHFLSVLLDLDDVVRPEPDAGERDVATRVLLRTEVDAPRFGRCSGHCLELLVVLGEA